jgi:hypothetical protein
MSLVELREKSFDSMNQGNFEHIKDLSDKLNKINRVVRDKFSQYLHGNKIDKQAFVYFDNLSCDIGHYVLWNETSQHLIVSVGSGWKVKIPVEIAEKILVIGLP